MEIRPVKIRDIEKVRELELSCIREYFAETLENKWEDSGLSLVAEEDGEIVGFIFAQMLHHIADEDNLLWIENMGVHPYFRRNMVGYQLLRECVRLGREQGAGVAHAMIQPNNAPSILMFKKLGFFMDRREVALMDLNDPNLKL